MLLEGGGEWYVTTSRRDYCLKYCLGHQRPFWRHLRGGRRCRTVLSHTIDLCVIYFQHNWKICQTSIAHHWIVWKTHKKKKTILDKLKEKKKNCHCVCLKNTLSRIIQLSQYALSEAPVNFSFIEKNYLVTYRDTLNYIVRMVGFFSMLRLNRVCWLFINIVSMRIKQINICHEEYLIRGICQFRLLSQRDLFGFDK